MSLTAGIVGLPNVGKSTLFNAITKAGALAANYPFATIDPNVGIVEVPDERLNVLHKLSSLKRLFRQHLNLRILPELLKVLQKVKVLETSSWQTFVKLMQSVRLSARSMTKTLLTYQVK